MEEDLDTLCLIPHSSAFRVLEFASWFSRKTKSEGEQKPKWFCAILFHYGHLLFTWKTHWGLKFHFGPKWSLYRREFYFAWTHVNANNEVIKVTSNRSESFHEVVWVLLRFHVNPWSTDYIILMATYQNTKNLSKNAEIYYTQSQWANQMQCLKSKSIGREKW